MNDAELRDFQLLGQAKAALRDKDIERAKPLLAEFSARRIARIKAKVANDAA